MLRAEKLSKSFGDTEAVREIDIEIEKGEIIGLLGPNGAGKTTTMQMLSGLMKPDSGTVEIGEGTLKESVSVVFQEVDYSSKLKAGEFLKLMAMLNENVESLGNTIEEVGLEEYRSTFVGNLSGGNKKKMNIATGLLKQPDYLLLDEPTSGLDPRARKDVRDMIQDFASDRGVLVSTHSMEEAEKVCDRVIIIEKGSEVVSGSPADLISEIDAEFVIKAEGEVPEGFEDEVIVENGFFEVKTDSPHEAVKKLVESGEIEELENLTIEKPGLEDVFFEVTGRRYEEDN